MSGCCADLARRLRAAADGRDYQQDLSDEDDEEDDSDAEISELEEDVDAHSAGGFAENSKLSRPDKAPEEEEDVRNSPEGHPWGAEVGTCLFLLSWLAGCGSMFETCVGDYVALGLKAALWEHLLPANACSATDAGCFQSACLWLNIMGMITWLLPACSDFHQLVGHFATHVLLQPRLLCSRSSACEELVRSTFS